jgi:hypothetical protein
MAATMIDLYELPVPVIETYRTRQISPRMSLELEVDYVEDTGSPDRGPSSERWARSRTWTSED